MVVVYGKARIVTDLEEARHCLYGLIGKYFPQLTPGKELRPITDNELKRTTDTLAAVLTREPDWSALPAAAARVGDVLERCLERDPRRRLRDAGDVRLERERAAARTARSEERGAPAGSFGSRRLWIAVALVAGTVPGILAARLSGPGAAPSRATRHLSIQLAPQQQLDIHEQRHPHVLSRRPEPGVPRLGTRAPGAAPTPPLTTSNGIAGRAPTGMRITLPFPPGRENDRSK